MKIHYCVCCEGGIPFSGLDQSLPVCKKCLSYLRPLSTPSSTFSVYSPYPLTSACYRILKHWKKTSHSKLEQMIFSKANSYLHQMNQKFFLSQSEWLLVPIPQNEKRAFHLKGSPALKIAKWISHELGYSVLELLEADTSGFLLRKRKRQAERSYYDRLEGGSPFRVRTDSGLYHSKLSQSHLLNFAKQSPPLLLIDDFATTGETLKKAKQTLIQSGFDQVSCFTLGFSPWSIDRSGEEISINS